ncbi:MAG: hypothetical protein IK015_06430 [Treponema sp.]|nr:hypothetical protein [Treponema sp.]
MKAENGVKKENETFKIKTKFLYTEKGLAAKEAASDSDEMRFLKLILKSVNKIMGKGNFCTSPDFYQKYFGSKVTGLPETKRFVRIKSMKTKKSVYRVWNAVTTDEIGLGVKTEGILYIDKEAKTILAGACDDTENDEGIELKFSRVPSFLYYFFAGKAFDKITYLVAWVSLLLAIVGLLLKK